MEELIFDKIKRNTGRKEIECSCELCRKQCKAPCLGTPDDILKLLEVGYRDRLSVTYWMVGLVLGKFPAAIPMVQAIRTDNGCVFFKDGLCELHEPGLKPTEGKLSHHEIRLDNFIFELSLSWNIAKEWINIQNRRKVLMVFFLMDFLK